MKSPKPPAEPPLFHAADRHAGKVRGLPSVPTTSIDAKSDGAVAWPCSINERAAHAETIEVQAGPIGMGIDRLALRAIADRRQQPAQPWRPFDVHAARRGFSSTTPHAPLAAASGT